jgi:hypothetical protein
MSTINFVSHGLAEAQPIKFANVLPDDTGIDENATYYVLDASDPDSFTFSEVPGGVAFTLASDITSGDVINPEEYTPLDPEEEPSNIQQGWTTVRDIEPPSIPGGLATTAAMNGAFARWNATTANDLAFFELRYAPDDGTGTGPDTTDWTTVRVKTTAAYLGGLPADTNADGFADSRYWLQVRAVDTTGNVAPWQADLVTVDAASNLLTTPSAHRFVEGDLVRFTALGAVGTGLATETDYYVIADGLTTTAFKVSATLGGAAVDVTVSYAAVTVTGYPLYRDYQTEGEQGWCIAVSVDPKLVDDGDITYQSIGTEHVKVTGLSAEVIKTGTLNVNTSDTNMTDGIKVYNDDAELVGLWNETGLYIYSEDDPNDYVRLSDGGISIYVDGVEQATLTPDGLNASALTFGSLPGGHNVILNSSFELSDFAAEPSQATWTASGDWSGTEVDSDNLTTGAGALTMAAASYA